MGNGNRTRSATAMRAARILDNMSPGLGINSREKHGLYSDYNQRRGTAATRGNIHRISKGDPMAASASNPAIERCIEECLQCVRWCSTCVEESLTHDPSTMAECIRLCHECTPVCGACVTLLSGNSRFEY